MLLLPSRYEGFGFTALEAMTRGCPVFASDVPAVREISGDGAMLLPLDGAAWAAAMRRVLGDDRLREELRRRGRRDRSSLLVDLHRPCRLRTVPAVRRIPCLMPILLVNSHGADPAYGGAERYVRDLAGGMERRGHDITVLSAFPARGDADVATRVLHRTDWRDARLRRVRNHVGDLVSAPWQRLDAVLDSERPDLLHTSNLPGIGSGIWECARRREIPVVHTLHDYHLLCPRTSLTRRDGSPCRPSPLLCGLRTRRLSRWAGAVGHLIAGSDHLLRVMNGLFPAADPHVVRLPLAPVPGAGVARRRPLRERWATSERSRRPRGSSSCSRHAAARGGGARAAIGRRRPLREVVAASGVDYLGRVDGTAKGEFLSSCDIGVVPSLWDEPSGPPYVVCEWLAAGRPVLVTRRPALLEAASRHGGIVPFEESTRRAERRHVPRRRDQEWARLIASLPAVEGDADVDRWLQDHERIFELALDGRRSAA